MYFVNYALGDEYFGILHYLPSTGHNDSMAVGYVLVNVTPGMEIEAFNQIKGMKHVDDITVLFGDYDLIIKLVAEDLASIAKTVVETIRPVKGVINTKTLAGADI
jgi:DNA-binding Lrp family transcriptional regulator